MPDIRCARHKSHSDDFAVVNARLDRHVNDLHLKLANDASAERVAMERALRSDIEDIRQSVGDRRRGAQSGGGAHGGQTRDYASLATASPQRRRGVWVRDEEERIGRDACAHCDAATCRWYAGGAHGTKEKRDVLQQVVAGLVFFKVWIPRDYKLVEEEEHISN